MVYGRSEAHAGIVSYWSKDGLKVIFVRQSAGDELRDIESRDLETKTEIGRSEWDHSEQRCNASDQP